MPLAIFEVDPKLKDVQGQIWDRVNGYKWWKDELKKNEGGIEKFAQGYKIFGFNRVEGGYTYREWLPNAKNVWLVGDFNGWQNTMQLTNEGFGRWCLNIKDKPDGSPGIPHKSQLKVRLETVDGKWHDRVPAWTKLAWQDPNTNLFNGVFWEPPEEDLYVRKHPRPPKRDSLKVYEAHVGMASFEPKVATYLEFAKDVLPRIKALGYNAVQLMAVAEHAHYGCFGYHVTSFFAPASRSGTPEELKELVDTAHGLGIQVLVDLVHAHCSSNSLDGIAQMDGTDHCYTHGGPKGHHSAWDSKIFDTCKYEVMRFLLSNVRWWLDEFGFDGFRFDGITSMLYHSHGIGKGYTGGYHEYFGPDADVDNHIYLMLANDLIHTVVPSAVTVGEDVSGMPTLCRPVEDGGFGFDYRLAMAIPDMFIKLLKESTDDCWDMGYIVHTLTNRRWKEKVIGYAESHDQAIVGDKTIAFWLMDAEMYTSMSLVTHPQASMNMDRGMALHRIIRLLVLGLGGEGYLNFMGNEFGHPEWIDFPREENGWAYHHCRRRWDLADTEHLRYQWLQAFDALMQAAENRWKWLSAEEQFICVVNNPDKVIAFERGDLLFVFNLHPTNSYENYAIGTNFKEPMKTVLDTDEGRFGGQMRLEHGHAVAFKPGPPAYERPHSISMYLPARTGQVLAKEKVLDGGLKIHLSPKFLAHHGLKGPEDVVLTLEDESEFRFDDEGMVELEDFFGLEFRLENRKGKLLKCQTNFDISDPTFRICFPGDYIVEGVGYLEASKPPAGRDLVKETAAAAKEMEALKAKVKEKPKPLPKAQASSKEPVAKPKRDCPGKHGLQEVKASISGGGPVEEFRCDVCSGSITSTMARFTCEECDFDLCVACMNREVGLPKPDKDTVCPAPLQDLCKDEDHMSKEEDDSFDNMAKCISATEMSNALGSDGVGEMRRVSSLSCLDDVMGFQEHFQLRKKMDEFAAQAEERPARYGARHLGTPVVVVSSEMAPWSKTGGLAMVTSSYAYEFAMRGHRTMAVVPRYEAYENTTYIGCAKIPLERREIEVQYYHQRQSFGEDKGCDFVFVQADCFRRPGGLYGDASTGKEYEDNLFRFALLSLAAAEAPLLLTLNGSTYGQDVLFIANDWQTAMLPVYLAYKYRRNGTYKKARCIQVIHNLGFQGKYRLGNSAWHPIDAHMGLPADAIQDLQGEDLVLGTDCINLLQAGIRCSDRVLTVSPSYASEIQTPEGGHGLHEILVGKGAMLKLGGILNGISDEWSPLTDPHIEKKYGPKDFKAAKALCKDKLRAQFGMQLDPSLALIGFCGRLCFQKGVHLIMECLDWLMQDQGNGVNGRVQLIMMGKGDANYAKQVREAENKYKGRVCGYVGFDPAVEHKMMAGCDFILMPSQYEPCGLPQMYAQQYATLPIVHETGGLKDSVKGFWESPRDRLTATGYHFSPFHSDPLKERLWVALSIFQHDKELHTQLQKNAIRSDFYWPRAVDEYEKHFDWTLEGEAAR